MVAFKTQGFRPDEKRGHRQILFTALEHAVLATERDCGLFENANRTRNLLEYDGSFMLTAMTSAKTSRSMKVMSASLTPAPFPACVRGESEEVAARLSR